MKGKIRIVEYQGTKEQLGNSEAVIYIVNAPPETVEALAYSFDSQDSECEWLFSYPGYGDYATPVNVLIQQDRERLKELREKSNASS